MDALFSFATTMHLIKEEELPPAWKPKFNASDSNRYIDQAAKELVDDMKNACIVQMLNVNYFFPKATNIALLADEKQAKYAQKKGVISFSYADTLDTDIDGVIYPLGSFGLLMNPTFGEGCRRCALTRDYGNLMPGGFIMLDTIVGEGVMKFEHHIFSNYSLLAGGTQYVKAFSMQEIEGLTKGLGNTESRYIKDMPYDRILTVIRKPLS
ncbi:MAG: hypothetical protein NDI94_05785 [Candidatus Woesearchaeota archaeon]|nr:hypothetical protein [Candidatus Woesearchaeota archaeon]